MVGDKDIYDLAQAARRQFGSHAESHAIAKMNEFIDQADVVGASKWLMVAQIINDLEKQMPTSAIN